MKVLLIIVALSLIGWSVKYLDRIGDFNEKRWKEPDSINSPIIKFKDIQGNEVGYQVSFFRSFSEYRSIILLVSKIPISLNPIVVRVAIREPNGKVTKLLVRRGKPFKDNLKPQQVVAISPDNSQTRKLIALTKKHVKLKISVSGIGGNYVFDLDCRGFTKAWRKTGW